MYENKKIAVILAAAGTGTRMNSSLPKQFLKLDGKAMMVKAAEVFLSCGFVDRLVVSVNAGSIDEAAKLFEESGINVRLVPGGEKRKDSVYAGLIDLPEDIDFVLIHDAARPYVTRDLIEETLKMALEKKAVVCAVPVKDTIRMKTGRESSVTTDRSLMYAVQTPQAFEKNLIIKAYEQAYGEGFYGTDDAALAERAGYPVHIVKGSYENIKITTKSDMPVKQEIRAGTGFDVHAFESGRKLILGGVEIPFEKGLMGHSDADVLIHAVMDAMLGAAGLGDIGRYFPDSDEKYRDISSLKLLEETAKILRANGYEIGNIDVTVIAENPKIAPFIDEMSEKTASAAGIGKDLLNIKGTTTEGLGFTGRGEGIAASAVCTLRLI